MANNAYLIISDLHDFYKNIENRINYVKEIDVVKQKILEIGIKYREAGWNVNAILLGDVFHRAYQSVDFAILANNYWMLAKKLFTNIYCVLGNHETTYYASNPFYTLVNSIESEKVRKILNKVWQPRGLENIFRVVDTVVDGNVILHFNHYGTPISRAIPEKVNIGLYHQDIINSEIRDLMTTTYSNDLYYCRPINFDKTDIFDGFAYNFFGHMHKVYGTWKYKNASTKKETVLCYLASLGRPNVTEVQDNFLERNIPVICIKDGELSEVNDNIFMLPSRASCVKEDVVKVAKEAYQKVKERRELLDYVPTSDDPVKSIEGYCMDAPALLRMFIDLKDNEQDRYMEELLYKYKKVIGVNL